MSTGLVDGWTKRLLFGMYYDRNVFLPTPATTLPAKPLPAPRTLSYPFVGFDILEDKYGKQAMRTRSARPRICISGRR